MSLENIRRKVWERDRYRCQECGIRVGLGRGLRPHTHHMVPKSLGGSDQERNLITLCQPCHTAKVDHRFMLAKVQVKDYPQYIKHSLWQISLKLLDYADVLDPRKFPEGDLVIQNIEKLQRYLDVVKELAGECEPTQMGKGFAEDGKRREVEEVIEGIRISWTGLNQQKWIIFKGAREKGLPRKRV